MLDERTYTSQMQRPSAEDHQHAFRLRKEIVAWITEISLIMTFALACTLLPVNAAAQSIEIQSINRSNYISEEDIKKVPGGYKFYVEDVGDVLVKEIRAPKSSGKKCMIDKRSLSELVRGTLPITHGPTWLRMTLISIPEELGLGSFICISDGVGCYILVSPSLGRD